jgi:hypothetical protein
MSKMLVNLDSFAARNKYELSVEISSSYMFILRILVTSSWQHIPKICNEFSYHLSR